MQEVIGCLFVLVTTIFISIPALCACSVSGKDEQHHGCKKNAFFWEKEKTKLYGLFCSLRCTIPSPFSTRSAFLSAVLSSPGPWVSPPAVFCFKHRFLPAWRHLQILRLNVSYKPVHLLFMAIFLVKSSLLDQACLEVVESCWALHATGGGHSNLV